MHVAAHLHDAAFSQAAEHAHMTPYAAVMIQLTMSGLYHVMLGLEDPFRQRGGSFSLDRIQVPEMVDVTRRTFLKIEQESTLEWNVPANRVFDTEAWGYSVDQLAALTRQTSHPPPA
jgi:hypothetical protein